MTGERWNKVLINRFLKENKAYFRFADDRWKSTKHRHSWACVFGHRFSRSWDGLRELVESGRHPCKKCHPTQSREELLRFAFVSITNQSFPKMRPEWLVNPSSGERLELDGFNESLNLAFEYDGEQHERQIDHFHNKAEFQDQQNRDQIKDKLCKKRGVRLIRVKFDEDFVSSPDLLIEKIRNVAPSAIQNQAVQWSEFASSNDFALIERARAYASERNGQCLSDSIFSMKDRVKFHCREHDHTWEAVLNVVFSRKQWCRICGYRTGSQKQVAIVSGEELNELCSNADPVINYLDWAGLDKKGRSLWKCCGTDCEFPFKEKKKEVARKLSQGKSPCPSCNKKRRIEIWEMHQEAYRKGGVCLDWNWQDGENLRFKCHNEAHSVFSLAKSKVRNGTWCPRCHSGKKPQRIHSQDVSELAQRNGFALIGQYINNHEKLHLRCKSCSQERTDLNYRSLKRKDGKLKCDFCRPIM